MLEAHFQLGRLELVRNKSKRKRGQEIENQVPAEIKTLEWASVSLSRNSPSNTEQIARSAQANAARSASESQSARSRTVSEMISPVRTRINHSTRFSITLTSRGPKRFSSRSDSSFS